MMRVVVTENTPREVRLTAEQGHALALSRVVTASASPHNPELWTIKARGKVGVARVGDMEVWITPKLPIARLLFLAGYAHGRKPLDWRDEDVVALDTAEGLVPVVARFLCHQVELALRQGPLKGYRHRTLRGAKGPPRWSTARPSLPPRPGLCGGDET